MLRRRWCDASTSSSKLVLPIALTAAGCAAERSICDCARTLPQPTVEVAPPCPPQSPERAQLSASVSAVPFDLPPADSFSHAGLIVLAVEIDATGTMLVDGKRVSSDAELIDAGRRAASANPAVRAVIRADKNASHGTVIHALDLLKRAGISKIAFGVVPLSP
jgi:biopolymer transport protein ExbD